ncbi:hypothetical protein D9V29_11780 [Mycetocola manganoxydans]|uniref:Uncharacterized protein n=1 Tax=Mycetocola manganoxydans TaxID=699879 RepID=A0A3L6ZNB6_9MICO|nr:hypothetical protein [Mycetocola manganoxydans]RLP69394.1 hypothetical protein D9V29_11780 [Mycetocola manganoxydans]GHD50721.1 hypothetical protein GCM10008097_25010 [Mycetocola manganoxydans]
MEFQTDPLESWHDAPIRYLTQQLKELSSGATYDDANAVMDDESAVYLLWSTFDRTDRLLEVVEEQPEAMNYAVALRDALEEFPVLVSARRSEELLHLAERMDSICQQWIDILRISRKHDPDVEDLLRSLKQEHVQARIMRENRNQQRYANEEAQANLLVAKEAAREAQKSAGITGSAKFSEYFGNYADSELRTANYFRLATIAVIIGAITIAFTRAPESTDSLTTLAYRLAVLAGVAALGTYLGRQAGHHRRLGAWARGLEVQTKSFPAFMSPVTDDATRNTIYETFSRRVLSAPPEAAKSAQTDANPMLESVVAALVKRGE